MKKYVLLFLSFVIVFFGCDFNKSKEHNLALELNKRDSIALVKQKQIEKEQNVAIGKINFGNSEAEFNIQRNIFLKGRDPFIFNHIGCLIHK